MKKTRVTSPQIMFVDNDSLVRDSLKIFFDNGHAHYLIFKTGEEGLNSLKYHDIDVVVCDYFLPDMDGIQFLDKVKKQSEKVIRILMATLISDEFRYEIQAAGIDRFIEKPLTVAFLDTIINELTCHRKPEHNNTNSVKNKVKHSEKNMEEKTSWDWQTELKEIPVKEWKARFNWVQAPRVSHDGECIAAIVNLDEMAFNVCVNGNVWEGEYEKTWCLTPFSDNGFAAFVARDEEWTMAVNGSEWTNWCDFIWDMRSSPVGDFLGAAFQTDSEYGVMVNDVPWEDRYENLTGTVMAADGTSAAVVQVASMGAADVEAFKQGIFSVACNGRVKARRFLNIWDISFDASGNNISYGVRTDREAYTIVHNDTIWDNRFQSVWKPVFLDETDLLAPVRIQGKWQLYRNNTPFWNRVYDQLWHVTTSSAGNDVAAIVSTSYGRWTVAVNDRTWNISWDTMVSDIRFSEDGSCLAVAYKHKDVWDLAVNQTPWQLGADMVFPPCISPDGNVVAVVVEKKGEYQLVVNNRMAASGYSYMTDPVISPDGSRVLLKGIENGIYKRRVIRL